MKRTLLLFLVVLFALLAVTATAASNVFTLVSVMVEDDNILIHAITRNPCSSIQVKEAQLVKKNANSWENVESLAFPEISTIGNALNTNIPFDDQGSLIRDGEHRICVTIDADGHIEEFCSEPLDR